LWLRTTLSPNRVSDADGRYHAGMPGVIKSVSFDAHDALALATFWAGALGSDVDEDSTSKKAFVEAAGWGGRAAQQLRSWPTRKATSSA
jgi:hypothetical protein